MLFCMLFNSIVFICAFLPVVSIVFFLLGSASHRLAGLWLCAASIFFYGWWNYQYIGLLLVSVLFNYSVGYLVSRYVKGRRQRVAYSVLALGVGGNLALLGYYKYAHFFLDTANQLLGANWTIAQIILPLGISFFTFTQIAFLVDSYRGKASEYDFVHYLLFVTYFPHLIAGPILHHSQMMPQFALKNTYRLHWPNVATGVTFFVLGLGKKVLLADMFADPTHAIFGAATHGVNPMLIEAWIGALSYTLQLYFDFSGYTDMAIGISYIFNIKLPLNFNSPYKAENIIDFWRRWHMTLSAFLRDYLYIPLGGNRLGSARRYLNLMVTMLLGGLWHGAGWTFLIWGGLHGFYLVVNHGFRSFRERIGWVDGRFGHAEKIISVAVTFWAVVIAWVFFRANNLGTAMSMVRGMVGLNGISLIHSSVGIPPGLVHWLGAHGIVFLGFTPITLFTGATMMKLMVGLAIVWFMPNTQEWLTISAGAKSVSWWPSFIVRWRPESTWTSVAMGILLGVCLLTLLSGAPSEFLYFQF